MVGQSTRVDMRFDQTIPARIHQGRTNHENYRQRQELAMDRQAVEHERHTHAQSLEDLDRRQRNLEIQFAALEVQQRRLETDELAFRPMRQELFEASHFEEAIRQRELLESQHKLMGQLLLKLHEQSAQFEQERCDLEHQGDLIESAMHDLDERQQELDELDRLQQADRQLPSERATYIADDATNENPPQSTADHHVHTSKPGEAILTRQAASLLDVAVSGGELHYALSGGVDKTLRVWDLAAQEMIRAFDTGHSICACWLSFDGRHGVLGHDDNRIRLFDLESEQCIKEYADHSGRINSVCVRHDGTRLLSASDDRTARLWDVDSTDLLLVLRAHEDAIAAVCFADDGQKAVSASWDHTLRLWDLAHGECLQVFSGHQDRVTDASVSPCGQYLLSASEDTTVRLWSLDSGDCVHSLEGHKNRVNTACFVCDGQLAVSGGDDRALKIWNLSSGQAVSTVQDHWGWISRVTPIPDSESVISASWDGTLRLHKIYDHGRQN